MPEATILDDHDKVRQVDRYDMLSFCVDAPRHYEEARKLVKDVSLEHTRPHAIIIAGMGGSAIGGELLKDWTKDKIGVPVEVCREYSLPEYADGKTLVFVVSYSGETEESLSAFLDALKRKCMTVSVSSGGVLQEFAERLSIPHLLVPTGMAPRATLPYLFVLPLMLLDKEGIVSGVGREVSEAIKTLKNVSDANRPDRPLAENPAKTLSSRILGTIPVVYGFGRYRAVAQRLKTQFNENSKTPAKWESFPELNHNEIVGWEAVRELAKCFSVTFIRDQEEPQSIRHRIEATGEILHSQSVKTYEIKAQGGCALARMASAICTGDFTSVYLAILRGVDPTPVKTINMLKEKIKRSGTRDKVIGELKKLAK